MDLLCHCVSQDCTNCLVYKAWLEGKDPQQIFNEMKKKVELIQKDTGHPNIDFNGDPKFACHFKPDDMKGASCDT